jgi:hypothetical protein
MVQAISWLALARSYSLQRCIMVALRNRKNGDRLCGRLLAGNDPLCLF